MTTPPYRVRLTRLVAAAPNHAMRTSEMDGITYHLPTVGERFLVWGESLTPGSNARSLSTSAVVEYDMVSGIFRTTSGTEYHLEVLQW